MANTKMTQVQALETAIAIINGAEIPADVSELTEKLTAMHDNIVKKNASRSDKPTAKQLENAEISAAILETLTIATEPMTVKQIMEVVGHSSQKITALLTAMVKAEKVINTKVKKISYYEIAKTTN